jgi:hypothetical protein
MPIVFQLLELGWHVFWAWGSNSLIRHYFVSWKSAKWLSNCRWWCQLWRLMWHLGSDDSICHWKKFGQGCTTHLKLWGWMSMPRSHVFWKLLSRL